MARPLLWHRCCWCTANDSSLTIANPNPLSPKQMHAHSSQQFARKDTRPCIHSATFVPGCCCCCTRQQLTSATFSHHSILIRCLLPSDISLSFSVSPFDPLAFNANCFDCCCTVLNQSSFIDKWSSLGSGHHLRHQIQQKNVHTNSSLQSNAQQNIHKNSKTDTQTHTNKRRGLGN